MNKSRQLNIRLLDYWISGTGTADGPSIDEQVCRDSSGLPYFPASALKGVLKHAIDCAEAWGYYEDIKTQKGWANILFGHATTRDNSTSGILEANNAELPSDLKQLLSIEPKYRETLHRTLHATAIDDANGGVAKDKSLRGMEVTLPLPNPLQTIIRVKDSAANAEWDTVLERALPLVTAIGKNRTRGLGRVQLTLTPILDMPPALHQNHPSVSISENSNFTPGLKRMILNIECLQESILSQQGGSATQHETLDYIPGARLMGAVAALYKLLEPAEARWLFESGNVRFGDARRVTSSGKTAIPSPLSYHHPKSKLAICKGYLDIQAPLIDLVYPEQQQCIMVSETQWSTLAPCEIDPETGEHLPLAKQFRMRTAVDAVTGGAANAQLYGHESSVAGLRFRSEVVARASSPAQFAILMKIRDQIQNLKSVGKYRSSGYGQIDIKAGEWEDVQLPAVPTNRTISLHLLSDLAVCNQWGQPTLTPESTDLHLPAGQRLDYLCFVKTRRYSSYNSYLRSQNTEREVLQRGSVLTFRFDTPLTKEVMEKIYLGLGMDRVRGMGEVALSTPDIKSWIRDLHPTTQDNTQIPDYAGADVWLKWLEERMSHDSHQSLVEKSIAELKELYLAIKRFHGQLPESEFGPSPSQWGQVLQKAKSSKIPDLLQQLEADKRDNPWLLGYPGSEGKMIRFIDWLNEKAKPKDMTLLIRIAHAAQNTVARAGQ